mgnify:CR=1 FL=1
MKQFTFLLILCLGQTSLLPQDKRTDTNFRLIEDFEKHKSTFQSDTFELYDHSTDGGQLIAYYAKDKEYRVFDIWLFGETGKLHATYWTDNDLKIKIIKRTNFDYDKPYYEKGYKVTETMEYLSHEDNSVKRYNRDKRELNDGLSDTKASEGQTFFDDIIKDVNIMKLWHRP